MNIRVAQVNVPALREVVRVLTEAKLSRYNSLDMNRFSSCVAGFAGRDQWFKENGFELTKYRRPFIDDEKSAQPVYTHKLSSLRKAINFGRETIVYAHFSAIKKFFGLNNKEVNHLFGTSLHNGFNREPTFDDMIERFQAFIVLHEKG